MFPTLSPGRASTPRPTRSPLLFPALFALSWLLLALTPALGQAPTDDPALQRQLGDIYASIEGLDPVTVEVNAGVVTLGGEVVSEELRERAGGLAVEFEGVVDVQNDITVSTRVMDRLGPALERLEDRSLRVLYNIPLFIVGVLILWVAWWLASRISEGAWIERRVRANPFMVDIVRQLVRVAIMVAAALFVLDLLDLTALVGAVLGAAGVATLAVGFAFRDLIENYIASVLLSLRQPFEPNDLVELGGQLGRVSRLTSRATILVTPEGNHVRIPNAQVFKSEMVNYSRNPQRRFDFQVGVDVELELSPVQAMAERVVGDVDGVLEEPAPFCLVTELGDSSVILRIFGWVDQTRHDFGRVRSEAIRQVKEAFDEADIVMPEPTYSVKMLDSARIQPDAALPRAEREPAKPDDGAPGPEDRAGAPRGQDTRHRDETQPVVAREADDGQNLLDPDARKE